MLLSEQIRSLADEEVLVANPNSYTTTTVNVWTTVRTENITLTAQKIIYVRFQGSYQAGDTSFQANARVLLGGVPILVTGLIKYNENYERDILIILNAGSYAFDFQGIILYSAGTVKIDNIRIGACKFPDKSENVWDSGSILAPNGVTTTILNQNFTLPSVRKTVAGQLKQSSYFITMYIMADFRKSRPKNVGEADDSGWFNWRVYLDGVEKGWNERNPDGEVNLNAYGMGAHGRVYGVLNAGSTHTLRVDVKNLYGSDLNCRVYARAILCPWMLCIVDSNVLDLDIPQGSTLYVMLEPLWANSIKYAKVGKERIVDYGANYYGSSSGQGLLTFSYTFEIVDPSGGVLNVSGHGTCISYLAVDVR